MLLENARVLGKRALDELVIEAMELVDNAPEGLDDLRTFGERLRRSLDAVEGQIADRSAK